MVFSPFWSVITYPPPVLFHTFLQKDSQASKKRGPFALQLEIFGRRAAMLSNVVHRR